MRVARRKRCGQLDCFAVQVGLLCNCIQVVSDVMKVRFLVRYGICRTYEFVMSFTGTYFLQASHKTQLIMSISQDSTESLAWISSLAGLPVLLGRTQDWCISNVAIQAQSTSTSAQAQHKCASTSKEASNKQVTCFAHLLLLGHSDIQYAFCVGS